MYTKRELINSLNVVKQDALSGNIKETTAGICLNWTDELGCDSFGYVLVEQLAPSWEHYSGEMDLPIVGCYARDKLWEGEQLELRLSLIDHILKQLEEASQEWLDKLYSDYCVDENAY